MSQKKIISDGLQLDDGNIYNFIPPLPTAEHRGGISLEDKEKYDSYEDRIAELETIIESLKNN